VVDLNIKKNDSIAQNLSWSPAKAGGSNFKTHRRLDDAVHIKFIPTFFAHFFMLAISLFVGYFIYIFYTNPESINFNMPNFLIPVFPFIFLGGIVYAIYEMYKPRVFNLKKQVYQYSWLRPEIEISHLDSKHCIHFSMIHALQILDELIEDDDGHDYTSTELNLVLKDGQRMNIIDHSDRSAIMQDAKFLARKLIVPVWYQEAGQIQEFQPTVTKTSRNKKAGH